MDRFVLESSLHESQGLTLRRMVIIQVLLVLLATGIYDTVVYRHPSQPPFTFSNPLLTQTSDGEILLQIRVTNTGVRPIQLNGMFQNQFVPPLEFQPSLIQPGSSSIGSARSSWKVATFDGLSTYVRTPNAVAMNSRNLTVELFFKYASLTPDRQMIIDKGQAGQNSFYFYSFRSVNNINDFVIFANDTRYDQQLGDVFVPGNWYDVVFTIDGREVTAYVNGNFAESWPHAVSFLGNSQDLFIGSCSCGGYQFNGSMATVRLYDRPLSFQEIRYNYINPQPIYTGLSLWYQFNQTSGEVAKDLSGRGNDGAVNGSLSFQPPLEIGRYYSVVIAANIPDDQGFSLEIGVKST